MRGTRLPALTSIRFFAALYVVLFHTFGVVFPINSPIFTKFIENGFAAVSFFFTLSGYILATVYCRDETRVDGRKFLVARFARIYPLFVAALAFDTPNLLLSRIAKYGLLVGPLLTSVTFGANLVMVQAWVLRLGGINDPGWSLSVETFFYLCFPLIAMPLWRLRPKTALLILPVLYLAGLGMVALAIHAGVGTGNVKFNPILHMHEFCLGILIARLHAHMSEIAEYREKLRRLSPWFLLAGCAGFLSIIELTGEPAMLFIHDGLLVPAFGLVIVALASGNDSVTSIFSARWLVVLGEASYGLYLIHVPFWHYFEKLGLSQNGFAYAGYLVTTIGVSVLSYYYLETPARAAINSFFSKKVARTEHEHRDGIALGQTSVAFDVSGDSR